MINQGTVIVLKSSSILRPVCTITSTGKGGKKVCDKVEMGVEISSRLLKKSPSTAFENSQLEWNKSESGFPE